MCYSHMKWDNMQTLYGIKGQDDFLQREECKEMEIK